MQRVLTMDNRRLVLVGLVLMMGVSFVGTSVLAQTTTATLRGTILDDSGGVIPGASVTATSTTTGIARVVVTDDRGGYLIPKLPVGTYTLAVEMTGFNRLEVSGITLQVDQVVELNHKLTVGQINETITVMSEAPLINTSTAGVGELIENRKIVDLPLNGRLFLQLAQLSAGVTISPSGGLGAQLAGIHGPRINSNGGREDQNYFTIDGVNATDAQYGTLTMSPSVDAIQEFKVEQNQFSAENGRLGGAHINIIVKSGTNEFHGSVYEFLRNDVLDARNFFDIDKPPFRQNQYGFSVGGPIVKDRTFFFVNFEGLRSRKGITATGSVPSEAQRRGDLSSFSGTIRNPYTRAPFPGNVIPQSLLDPAAVEMLKFVPLPNLSGAGRNIVSAPSQRRDTDQYLFRIDHKVGNNDSVYGRFSYSKADVFFPFGPLSQFSTISIGAIPGFGMGLNDRARNLVVNWTRTFSNSVVGEFRFGINRLQGGQIHENSGNDYGKRLNIPGVEQTGELSGFPRFQTALFTDFGDVAVLIRRLTETYQYSGDISWARGLHSLKFGVDVQYRRFDPVTDVFNRGQYGFNGNFTGNAFADFLLGLPSSAITSQQSPAGDGLFRQTSWATYFQDSWRVRPNFTLNWGLRWEYFGLPTEKNNRLATFDYRTRRFILASEGGRINTASQIPGIMDFLGAKFSFVTSEEAGLPRALYKGDFNNFAPRFGFAWSIFENKTVLRGGYGVFFNETTINLLTLSGKTPPFYRRFSVPAFTLPPEKANIHVVTDLPPGESPSFNPRTLDYRDGYVQEWNLSLDHTLTRNLVLEVRYVGTKGTKLYSNDGSVNNGGIGNPATAVQRRPIPELGFSTLDSIGSSSYNALQVRLHQKYSHGLSFTTNFSYGRSMDTDSLGQQTEAGGSGNDPFNRRLDWARSTFDTKYNFVANLVYALPLSATGNLGKIANGWQLGSILTLQTGRPASVTLSGNRSGAGGGRPNLLGNPNLPSSERTPDRWFETSMFALQAPQTIGNSGRSIIDVDGTKNVDFTLLKDTQISEQVKVQFRAEFFNLFNFVNFGYPNLNFVPQGGINGPTGAKNSSANFGKVFSANDPRIIQFGLKILF